MGAMPWQPEIPEILKMHGEPSWVRTSDLLIKSQLLYRLSYGPTLRVAAPSGGTAGRIGA